MKIVSFSLEQGDKYFATIDNERFFVGQRVNYKGGKGLMNLEGTAAQRYSRGAFRQKFGFWADFLHPIAMAEGALFHALNTYDRARFTFSFLQYTAHEPNSDFITYLRDLLKLPLASEYFPDLVLKNNRVYRHAKHGEVLLESDSTTAGLLEYLNPSRSEIEDTEIIQAAKFIHWAQNDPSHRNAQVDNGVRLFKANMARYSKRYKLDGVDDITCMLICDIHHQGRAKSLSIVSALATQNPASALLDIGKLQYPERINTLQKEIKTLINDGTFGTHRYSHDEQDFVRE